MSWRMNVSNLLAANTSLGCMLAGARSLRGNVYTTPYPSHCPHIGSQYAYMDDLWQLDRSPASVPRVWLRSQVLQPSPTPLLAPVWQAALRDYPDPRLRQFLVKGLQEGFRIGYNAPRGQLRPAKRNIPSSYEHPEVVDNYLANECKLGRVLGPWLTPPPCPIHISRFGVIPKKSQPGKWRLIVDLSFPEGASVNDGIPPSYCSLRYPSIDMGIEQILTAGQGAQLSKLDIKDAYRIVPVHSDDWPIGMQWKGQYYMDTRLPFGLRSAPKLFTALADAAQWLIRTRGVTCCLHYLDDYFFVEPPHTPATALAIATNTLAGTGHSNGTRQSGRAHHPSILPWDRVRHYCYDGQSSHLFATEHAFYFSAMHIAGTDNGPADSLSRNHAALFRSRVPQASPIPDTVHPTLMQLFLAEHPPDWLSNSWRQQLTTILGKVLQNPHNAPTTLVSSNT